MVRSICLAGRGSALGGVSRRGDRLGRTVRAVVTLIVAAMPALGAAAPQTAPPAREDAAQLNPLASKEVMLRDRFDRFLDRVYGLRESLAETEPDNADRLERVLQRAGELGLAEKLEAIVRLLHDSPSLGAALDAQQDWLADADRLLAVLVERDSENLKRKEDIERTESYRRQVQEILQEQKSLRDASAGAGLLQTMKAQIAQAAKRIDGLLRRQQNLSERSADKAREEGETSKSSLPKEQGDLERDTRQLAEELEKLGALKPEPSADSPELESARQSAQGAAESAKAAAESMSRASATLGQDQPGSASESQSKAEEALREAKARLEQAERALQEPADRGDDAEAQDRLADKTGGLSDQMKQDESSAGGSADKSPSSGKSGSSAQSQQGLERAQGEMKDAAGKLGRNQPDDAVESQDRAIAELDQVQKELEALLQQLRQEDRAETLADLEVRFREMLSKQRAINDATLKLSLRAPGEFQRAEHLECASLATGERDLSQKAATCGHILEEEGTTIAFPRVVGQLAHDLGTLGDRLSHLLVGSLTQSIQAEVTETLAQLLEAIQKMQQENEQQAADSDSEQEEAPLLPTSAELKLLRSSQERINRRTAAVDDALQADSEPSEALAGLLQATAGRQAECVEIATEIRDRQNMP